MMSTFYYLICDRHRAHSRVIGGRSFPHRWWSNDGRELEDFLEAHADCKPYPYLVSEHNDRTLEYDEMKSTEGGRCLMSAREEIRKRLIAQGVDPVEADRIAVFEAER
jgi:hypothetical protein